MSEGVFSGRVLIGTLAVLLWGGTGVMRGAPNILLVIVDDLPAYEIEFAHTPNLDRLTDPVDGEFFAFDAFSNYAWCNPSRAALMSGLRPDQMGLYENSTHAVDLLPDHVWLPELLQEANYRTWGFGKVMHGGRKDWNCPGWTYFNYSKRIPDPALTPASVSNGQGEIEVFPELYQLGGSDVNGDGIDDSNQFLTDQDADGLPSAVDPDDDNRDVDEDGYPDGLEAGLTGGPDTNGDGLDDERIRIIQRDEWVASLALRKIHQLSPGDEDPWFIAMGFWKPHNPVECLISDWNANSDEKLPLTVDSFDGNTLSFEDDRFLEPLTGYPRWPNLGTKGTQAEVCQRALAVRAVITGLDRRIGHLEEVLRSRGLWENTLIIITSDHGIGGLGVGNRQQPGKTWPFYCGNVIPLFVKPPGPRNPFVGPAIVETVDLHATILDYAGAGEGPTSSQGHSLRPVIERGDISNHLVVQSVSDNRTASGRPWWYQVVRTGGLAALRAYNGDATVDAALLFDRINDPWEIQNLTQDPADPTIRALFGVGWNETRPIPVEESAMAGGMRSCTFFAERGLRYRVRQGFPLLRTSRDPASGEILLSWNSIPGMFYNIEAADHPTGPWETVRAWMFGAGGVMTTTVPVSEPRQLFRLTTPFWMGNPYEYYLTGGGDNVTVQVDAGIPFEVRLMSYNQ